MWSHWGTNEGKAHLNVNVTYSGLGERKFPGSKDKNTYRKELWGLFEGNLRKKVKCYRGDLA